MADIIKFKTKEQFIEEEINEFKEDIGEFAKEVVQREGSMSIIINIPTDDSGVNMTVMSSADMNSMDGKLKIIAALEMAKYYITSTYPDCIDF